MSRGFEKRRVMFFRNGEPSLADPIARHGGVPLAVGAAGDPAESPKGAVQQVMAGAVDFLLYTHPDQVGRLVEAAGKRPIEFLDALARVGIATLTPETTAAVAAADLRTDYEADPPDTDGWIAELGRRGLDLLDKKRRAHRHGIDTNRWRRIDARWAPDGEPGSDGTDPIFLRACRRQPVPHTPIWIMRQAGRYQAEYRALRAKVPFLDLCHDPELAAEVTLMAVDRLGVDAAIIFSDILMVLEPLGIPVRFTAGAGPVIDRPVRTAADFDRLPAPDGGPLEPVCEAIRLTRRALRPDIALIGFCGAPFTVATYIIEGGKSRHFEGTKGLMWTDRATWDRLMERLTTISIDYLNRQIAAGADAVQLFDSWIGILGPDEYREFVQPHMKRLIGGIDRRAPLIHFGTGNPALLPLQKEAGGDVIGLDWRVDLDAAWRQLGDDVAVMGNLDPVVLLSPPEEIRRQARRLLERAGGRPGHIFNLGHGVLPGTPPDHVAALIDAVQEGSQR